MKRTLALFLGMILSQYTQADIFNKSEIDLLKSHMMENIAENGAVLASPSRSHPDYYYDWVRDGAIAMDLIAHWYEKEHLPEDKEKLIHYLHRAKTLQRQQDPNPMQDILGEPKFYLDGLPYDGP